MYDLNTFAGLPAGTLSIAFAINNSGQVLADGDGEAYLVTPTSPTLISVTWYNLDGSGNPVPYPQLIKDSPAVGGWVNDTFQSDGTTPIADTTWAVDPAQPGVLTVMDPVWYAMQSRPIMVAKLKGEPSTSIKLRVAVEPPELGFDDRIVNFDAEGNATTAALRSNISIDKVHNQNYTFIWSASFDGGQTFSQFATSTQVVFVGYALPRGISIGGAAPVGAVTARRMDYATRKAEGTTTIISVDGGRTRGATESVIVALKSRFGLGINGWYLGSQELFWSLLDNNSLSDCLGLAGLGAFVLAELGVPSGYDVGWTLAQDPTVFQNTNATVQAHKPLPAPYQDSAGSLQFNAVYFTSTGENDFEGDLQVDDGSGAPKAYTVGPPAGPILNTTCTVDPSTQQNLLSFSVINKTLIGIGGASSPQVWWLDPNSFAPRQGPFYFPRSGHRCFNYDFLAPPVVQ